MKTVRRDVLKRMIVAGSMEAKCLYWYTDDYAFDASNNDGKTDWIPARLSTGRDDWKQGWMNFKASDFTSDVGRAWENENESGIITLHIHSNHVCEIRRKA